MAIDKIAGMPIEQLADILRPPGSRNPKQYLYVTADDQAICTHTMVCDLLAEVALDEMGNPPMAIRRLEVVNGLIRIAGDEDVEAWLAETRQDLQDDASHDAWYSSPERSGR